MTLAAATVRRPVGSALDLGTGCGVQALHASRHARRVTGTDVAPRALALAAATFALNDVDVELVDGPWLAPVAGRRFDQIVSNPPFVPGPARVEFVYRDSGEDGDAALAALVADLAGHLAPGGVAQLLASWLHVRGEDWPDRVRSWLPAGLRRVGGAARGGRPGAARRHLAARRRPRPGLARRAATQARAWLEWMDRRGRRGHRVRPAHAAPHRRRTDGGVRGRSASRSTTRSGRRSRGGWTASTGCAPTPTTRRCCPPGSTLAPVGAAGALVGARPRGLDDGGRARWRARTGRGGGTRWTARPRTCWRAATARCRSASSWSCSRIAHDRPTDALVAATLPAVREFVRHGLLVPARRAGGG